MTILLKDPRAVLDYTVDWGSEHHLSGDALTESSWTVFPPESGGLSIMSSRFENMVSTVQVGGGIAGRLYRLTNHAVTAEGREDSRSIMLRVEQR